MTMIYNQHLHFVFLSRKPSDDLGKKVIQEFKNLTDLNKKGKFEEADPFCQLVYTDFYKQLDKFFMSLYKEQQAHTGDFNRFNPATFQLKWHPYEWLKKKMRHFVERLKKSLLSEIWKVERPSEEALILNITKEKNYVLKYFDSLITERESYSKQAVLITICLWMTILDRKDFFKADDSLKIEDNEKKDDKKESLSNQIFTAFQVFTTKSKPILSKNDKKNQVLLGIPADKDDVNAACNVDENDVTCLFICIFEYILC